MATVVIVPLTVLLARRRTKDKHVAPVEPVLVEPKIPKDPLAEDLENKKDVLDMLGRELGLALEPAPTLEELLNKYRQIRR